MNLLIEAFYISSEYITGIERHFTLQLQILEKINKFNKITIITNDGFSLPVENYISKMVEIIKIKNNSRHAWEKIYQENKIDLLYCTFTLPPIFPKGGTPVVYVLHDPGRYIYPELMEEKKLDSNNIFFEEYIKKNNFHVITVSNSSKIDIVKYFPCLARRVHVVYNFVSNSLLREPNYSNPHEQTLCQNSNYFLTIGRFIPTKNTLNIVKAFEKRSSNFKNFKLIIVGRKGWYSQLDNYLEDFSPQNVVILNKVQDSQLVELYRNCYGIISASLYEGFCMPLVESFYCGCTRIFCSDINVFHEINYFDFIFFDPSDVDDMVSKIFSKKINNYKSNVPKHNFVLTIEESCVQFNNILKKIIADE